MQAVIITGASEGIGRAMALSFAKRGYAVGLIARREGLLKEVAKSCLSAGAPQAEFRAGDVSDSTWFRKALNELDVLYSGADYFVANAGISCITSPFLDNGVRARMAVAINVSAAIDGIELIKTKMVSRGKGTIVGVSSIASARGMPGNVVYCATKAAFNAYLEGIQIELKPTGIRVIDVAPGFIDTSMTRKNKHPMPFLMNVDQAGELFVRDIFRGKSFIIHPKPYAAVFLLLKCLPRFLYGWVMGLALKRILAAKQA